MSQSPVSSTAEIEVSALEREYRTLTSAGQARAVETYKEHGALILKDVFSPELIEQTRAAIWQRYDLDNPEAVPENALLVGDKRYMISLGFAPELAPPDIFGSTIALSVLMKLLGDEMVLSSYTVVVAYPGADDQRPHLDNPQLYPEDGEACAIAAKLPPYAVTLAVPLIDLTPETGTTALWYGTQRCGSDITFVKEHRSAPYLNAGSAYMMDYRLVHGGLANTSDRARPILYLVYTRPWYQDWWNFKQQKPLQISREELEAVPHDLRALFKFTPASRLV